jgi:hypothetical protein
MFAIGCRLSIADFRMSGRVLQSMVVVYSWLSGVAFSVERRLFIRLEIAETEICIFQDSGQN